MINTALSAAEKAQMTKEEEQIKLIVSNWQMKKALEKVLIGTLTNEQMMEFAEYLEENGCEYVVIYMEQYNIAIQLLQ